MHAWVLERNENIWPQRDLYKNVHSRFINNSYPVEVTQVSATGEWIIMVYLYSKIPCSNNKKNEPLISG